jgi:hypothetical protein
MRFVIIAVGVTVVMTMAMFVPVVPKFGLVEQKEKHQTDQQRQKQFVGPGLALEGFGQQVQKRRGQQCPGSQAEHVLGVAAEHTKTQPSGHPDAADARHQSAQQNRQKSHHQSTKCLQNSKTNRPEGRFSRAHAPRAVVASKIRPHHGV